MSIIGIVALDKNGAIGKGGQLPWHYPADLKFFKSQTTGHACVMGYRTWLTLKRPLFLEGDAGVGKTEIAKLLPAAAGSVGRAISFAELDLTALEADATAMMREGDPSNLRRSRLAQALSGKAAVPRYAAFLELLPSVVALHARSAAGPARQRAVLSAAG